MDVFFVWGKENLERNTQHFLVVYEYCRSVIRTVLTTDKGVAFWISWLIFFEN